MILRLKSGFLGFEHSKVVISLNNGKHSIIVLSYNYDKSSYQYGDFRTYTGKINIFNVNLEQITAFQYFKGLLVKARKGSNPYEASGYWVEPESGYTDWCFVLPGLCNYPGNGVAEHVYHLMRCPDCSGGGSSGGSSPINDLSTPPFIWSYRNNDYVVFPTDKYPLNKPNFQFLTSDNYERKYPSVVIT